MWPRFSLAHRSVRSRGTEAGPQNTVLLEHGYQNRHIYLRGVPVPELPAQTISKKKLLPKLAHDSIQQPDRAVTERCKVKGRYGVAKLKVIAVIQETAIREQ